MSGFSADWLALREPLDAASRAADLATCLVRQLARRPPHASRLAIIDLGAGTGANLRYAAPRLGGSQDWLLVEHDASLLDAMRARMRGWSCAQARAIESPQFVVGGTGFECHVRSLSLDLSAQLQELPLPEGAILTASALLDLVSERWLGALLARTAGAAAAIWFALTYDGRIDCDPPEPEDAMVRELFNQHQLGDKGFGSALGPRAAGTAERLLVAHGYHVECASSDWRIAVDQPALQHALIAGWFKAACETAPLKITALSGWQVRRQAHIDRGRSALRVGHVDMVAWPQANGA